MRFHYLDFSRSALFFLGIVLHAAVLLGEQRPAFDSFYVVIHSFRMEAFFLIAGFFSAMSLARFPGAEFFRKRMIRLGVPFLFCALVLDTIANCANHGNWADFSAELSQRYWATGEWLQHLWFLPTLIAYTGALVGVQALWPSVPKRLQRRSISLGFFATVLSLMYFAAIHVDRVCPQQHVLNAFLDTYQTEKYSVYFAAGYVMFHHRLLLDKITRRWGPNLINVASFWVLHQQLLDSAHGRYVIQIWQPIYVLSVCGLLFLGARLFFNRESAAIRSFSDASYTVYLVHWPLLIVLNRLSKDMDLFGGIAFVALVVSTAALSFAFHHFLIKRSPLFAFLLNGRLRPASSRPDATALSAAA